jgi:hypothetical protein
MALFPNILLYDSSLQVNDKTRISGSKSYVSKDSAGITGVWVSPDVGTVDYIDVLANDSDDWFLDWQYAASGSYTAGVIIGADGATGALTGAISVVSEGDDKLFSTDQELIAEEPDILKWLPVWKSSWKFVHRRAQERMFAWLDEKGYTDVYANKFTKDDVVDIDELNEWSKYMVLRMIFEGISNSSEDFFASKAKYYESRELQARHRLILRIDVDADGVVDTFEDMKMNTGRVWRK